MKTSIALLDSEKRTATTPSDDVSAHVDDAGAMFFLDITKAPNNEEKLTLLVEAKDEASGKYVPITAFAASKKGSELAGGETLAFTVYPAAAETAAVGAHEVQALPIPKHFRVKVSHSGASEWIYSVGMQFLGG
jgi:hypothetical protein